MTNTELKQWEADLRELTNEELKLLRSLLELKRDRAKEKACQQSTD